MIGFDTLRDRLLAQLRRRIRNGELTERGLALSAGISQPHIHNILKGIRGVNASTADQLLTRLGINVLDLFDADELRRTLYLRLIDGEIAVEIPVLKSRLGPGLAWDPLPSEFERVRVPIAYLATARCPAVARLSADPAMSPILAPGDLLLLDSAERALESTDPEAMFAVNRGPDAVIRWIRKGRHHVYLVSAADRDEPHRWERVPRFHPGFLLAQAIPLRSMRRQEWLYDPLLPPRDTPPAPARRFASN